MQVSGQERYQDVDRFAPNSWLFKFEFVVKKYGI
jgi:hypothetical protein